MPKRDIVLMVKPTCRRCHFPKRFVLFHDPEEVPNKRNVTWEKDTVCARRHILLSSVKEKNTRGKKGPQFYKNLGGKTNDKLHNLYCAFIWFSIRVF